MTKSSKVTYTQRQIIHLITQELFCTAHYHQLFYRTFCGQVIGNPVCIPTARVGIPTGKWLFSMNFDVFPQVLQANADVTVTETEPHRQPVASTSFSCILDSSKTVILPLKRFVK